MAYPDVIENARAWVYSDDKPDKKTITVTVHGLRRLLRIAHKAQPMVGHLVLGSTSDTYADAATPKKTAALLNELSTIWCECNLVMSRLFVTEDGKAVAHHDSEVDAAGIAPWEPPAAHATAAAESGPPINGVKQ